jgi:hypothetical protein
LASNYFKIQIILLFPLTVLFVASCTNAGFSSVDKELKDTVDLALGLSVLAIATRAYQSSGGNLDLLVDGYSQVLYIRKISD